MQYVLVVDIQKVPQTPVHPAVARRLLSTEQAAVWRRYPFTLILKAAGPGPLFAQPCRLKIDPGSKTTGLAVLDGARVVWAAELTHRGQRIKAALETRRAVRRNRRQRTTRYRAPRFLNRTRPAGWLPPSLASRVANIMTWTRRLARLCPLGAISQELVRFDTQLMQNADISGVAYQQGTLQGYEVREYLLEKWHRTCAYCGAKDVPLEVEHIVPKARGGSDRMSNLTLACVPCNQQKDRQTAAEFGFPQIQVQAKQPLKDAAAVNTTRWALYRALQTTGLPVEVGTGGRTKFNRTRLRLPKTHWLECGLCGYQYARKTLAAPDHAAADYGDGSWSPTEVSDQPLWLSDRPPCPPEAILRYADGRYRQSGGAQGQACRHLDQSCGGQSERVV